MRAIKISITKFISDDQPGFVEASFNDAWGHEYIVHDKVPIFTEMELDSHSNYPQEGVIACKILKEWEDENKRPIVTIDISSPWDVSTIDGRTAFDVLATHLTDIKE